MDHLKSEEHPFEILFNAKSLHQEEISIDEHYSLFSMSSIIQYNFTRVVDHAFGYLRIFKQMHKHGIVTFK